MDRILGIDYDKALALEAAQDYEAAADIYQTMLDYKDCMERYAALQSRRYDAFSNAFPSNGILSVCRNGKFGAIDKTGKLFLPCEYDNESDIYFCEGLSAVEKDGKCGFVDTDGKLVIPCEFDEVYSFKQGLAHVKKNKKWGVIDNTGNLVVPFEYEKTSSFTEGFAAV